MSIANEPVTREKRALRLPGPGGVRFLPVQEIRKLAPAEISKLRKRAVAPDDGDGPDPEGADDNDDPMPTFRVAVSSEYPVERDFFGIRWREVLDHSPGAVRLDRFKSGRGAVLEEHRGVPIGVIDDATLDTKGKVLRADVRFSRNPRGQEAQRDVEDEVRTNISVGYIPTRAMLVEQNDEEGDLWRITEWEPVELSLVGIPADPTVGVGRSSAGETYFPVIIEDGRAVQEERTMKPETTPEAGGAAAAPAARAAAAVADPPNTRDFAEIVRMCNENGMSARAADFIEEGLTADQVARKIIDSRTTKGHAQASAEAIAEIPAKDMKNYSYQRAISMLLARAESRIGSFSGLEAEVSQEIERKLPDGVVRRGGILVPMNTRANSTIGLAKGTELVYEQKGELIELLRNQAMLLKMGARLLTGVTGPIGFAKQTGGATVTWMPENPGSNAPSADLAFGFVTGTPRTMIGVVPYTRQLISQASLDFEGLVREELAIGHGLAWDKAGLHGSGQNGEPIGLYKAAGTSVTAMGGTPTYGKLVDMTTQVANLNALQGSLGFLTTPTMAGKLRQTLVASAAGSNFIWSGTNQDGNVAGYTARATNQVSNTMTGSEATGGSENGLLFGNWSDVLVLMFNAMELVIDTVTLKKQAAIEVASYQLADIVLRHPESFSKATGAV